MTKSPNQKNMLKMEQSATQILIIFKQNTP